MNFDRQLETGGRLSMRMRKRKRKGEALTECEMNWINWVQIDVVLGVEGELIGID
jgi:hypothetical protein